MTNKLKWVGVFVISLLLLVSPVSASISLETRIASATGISRNIDVGLQLRAATRVVQIQTDFSHCCLNVGEAEVIAWNSGYADPEAHIVAGWLASPSHAAILRDPDYTRIGCAVAISGSRTYGICLLAVPLLSISPPPLPTVTPTPSIVNLPNTAMDD